MKLANCSIILLVSILAIACCKERNTTYIRKRPVYISYEDLKTSIKTGGPTDLQYPGKIYHKDNYLYINEIYKGIHVIDNTDPANPKNIAFISIPGNVDLAAKGNYLYVDNAVDLVVLDITDPTRASEVKRIPGAFPYYVNRLDIPSTATAIDKRKGVVVDWKDTIVTETASCN